MAGGTVMSTEEIDRLLEVNAELLCSIQQEANQRKNKNFVTANMANMICEYERNLMKLCINIEPGAMVDSEVIQKEKVMFHRIQPKKPTQPSQQQKR